METNIIYNKDCLKGLKELPDKSINLVVTSPPYNMNDDRYYKNYQDNKSSKEYVDWLLQINKEIYRVLKDDGVFVLNLNYNRNSPHENIAVFYECVYKIGFILREQIHWNKKIAMPITEIRNVTRRIESVMIFTKINEYKCNQKVNEPEFNEWIMKSNNTQSKTNKQKFKNSINNATFPVELPIKCINDYTYKGDIVLDPFCGLGTTPIACIKKDRKYIGFELDKETYEFSLNRIKDENKTKKLPF